MERPYAVLLIFIVKNYPRVCITHVQLLSCFSGKFRRDFGGPLVDLGCQVSQLVIATINYMDHGAL